MGIFNFNLFPDSLIKATEPSLIFSKPRYAVEYLSETTSPCSVYLIWDEIVPFGWAEIELKVGPPPLLIVPPLPWKNVTFILFATTLYLLKFLN